MFYLLPTHPLSEIIIVAFQRQRGKWDENGKENGKEKGGKIHLHNKRFKPVEVLDLDWVHVGLQFPGAVLVGEGPPLHQVVFCRHLIMNKKCSNH